MSCFWVKLSYGSGYWNNTTYRGGSVITHNSDFHASQTSSIKNIVAFLAPWHKNSHCTITFLCYTGFRRPTKQWDKQFKLAPIGYQSTRKKINSSYVKRRLFSSRVRDSVRFSIWLLRIFRCYNQIGDLRISTDCTVKISIMRSCFVLFCSSNNPSEWSHVNREFGNSADKQNMFCWISIKSQVAELICTITRSYKTRSVISLLAELC